MIRLEDIFVVFDKGSPLERTAIRDINFSINDGERMSIIGNNGSGKSTLLKLLAGHVIPSFGKIFYNDENITDKSMNEKAAIFSTVFADYNVNCFDNLTVIENLALSQLNTQNASMVKSAVSNKLIDLVSEYLNKYDFLDLKNILFSSIRNISYDQRQALCLLMALIRPTKVLLIDEFTYGMKQDTAQRLWNTAKQSITEKNMTVFAVVESVNVEPDFFNRTIVINSGKIVLDVFGEKRAKLDFNKIFENLDITPTVKNLKTNEVVFCEENK